MSGRDDHAEPGPPARPVKMVAVLAVVTAIVAWCVVAVFVLAKAVGR